MSTRKNVDVDIAVHKHQDLFEQGRKIARKADKVVKLSASKTIWFEDPKDLLKFCPKTNLISSV